MRRVSSKYVGSGESYLGVASDGRLLMRPSIMYQLCPTYQTQHIKIQHTTCFQENCSRIYSPFPFTYTVYDLQSCLDCGQNNGLNTATSESRVVLFLTLSSQQHCIELVIIQGHNKM